MNRLQSELQRLFVPAGQDPNTADLLGPDGQVRAMVLALARPAEWQALARVWHAVQADLALPAPAIAVAGDDGMQLWFPLAQALPAAQAAAFLERLRTRYLGAVDRHRVSLLPAVEPGSASPVRHATRVPAALATEGHWSAFVAPDLAPMFVDEPWLDMPPNPEGQADLLARVKSIAPADLQRALQRLQPAAEPADAPELSIPPPRAVPAPGADPRQFLLAVMNDQTVDLALRIEAAKALLPAAAGAASPRPTDPAGT
jgi:hypothetical protein